MKPALHSAWKMVMAVALIAALSWAAGASGPPVPGDKPAAPTAESEAPAAKAPQPAASQPAKPAPATQPKMDDDAIPPQLIRAAKDSFVIVETWYKKDLSESPAVVESDYTLRRIYSDCIDQKRPGLQPGLVLDDQGRVLIAEDGLEERFIDKIAIQDAAGKRYPGKRDKLLLDTPGLILRVAPADAAKLKPLKFHRLNARGIDTRLLVARMHPSDEEWRISVMPANPAFGFAQKDPDNAYWGYRPGGRYTRYSESLDQAVILADEDGRPVGVSLTSSLDLHQREGLWQGADLIKAEGISMADLAKAEAAIRERLTPAVQEVVFTLRQGSAGFEEPESYTRRGYRGGRAAGQEASQYGIAISPTLILVPTALTREAATQIEQIQVKFSPRDRVAAEFVGAYKGFGALVVKLAKGKLPAHLSAAGGDKDLPRMRPFWTARFEKRFGQKYIRMETNRLAGKSRGYAGKYHWDAQRNVENDAILLDFQGNLAGLYLRERIEDEEARRLESNAGDRYSRNRPESGLRIFTISEVRRPLAEPSAFLDPNIKVTTKQEAKRRAWFGVEYVRMTRDLAEQWKTEKPTKDGQLGFLVNAVYDGSPAQKLGIQVGDILLQVSAPGVPYPIELNAGRVEEDRGYGWRMRDAVDEDEGGLGPLPPTWKNRRNFLTAALDAIGVGKKIAITYYRLEGTGKGKEVTLDCTIQQAPEDFESAPKWKNRKLGLTVKDITYELRHALNIKDDSPGVVLANVEPGSPMLVAKIYPFEIITRLNDRPLKSARAMRDMIAAAKAAGKDKVRLTVLRLGKTRFADLAINDYDPQDDEGLDEE